MIAVCPACGRVWARAGGGEHPCPDCDLDGAPLDDDCDDACPNCGEVDDDHGTCPVCGAWTCGSCGRCPDCDDGDNDCDEEE